MSYIGPNFATFEKCPQGLGGACFQPKHGGVMSWQCDECDLADLRCRRAGRCMAAHLGPLEPTPKLTEEELSVLDPFVRSLLEEE